MFGFGSKMNGSIAANLGDLQDHCIDFGAADVALIGDFVENSSGAVTDLPVAVLFLKNASAVVGWG